jgi:hypothetical protein
MKDIKLIIVKGSYCNPKPIFLDAHSGVPITELKYAFYFRPEADYCLLKMKINSTKRIHIMDLEHLTRREKLLSIKMFKTQIFNQFFDGQEHLYIYERLTK